MEKESFVNTVNPQADSDDENVYLHYSFEDDGCWVAPRAIDIVTNTVIYLHKQCFGTLKYGVGPGANCMCAVPWLPLSANARGAHEI